MSSIKPYLVIGYGRAGKRHAKLLDQLEIPCFPVDPAPGVEFDRLGYDNLESALADDWRGWAGAVICTPPAQHLSQIRTCLEYGIPVLCEKPLCDFGQLAEARKLAQHPHAVRVGVTFNYRWHPDLDIIAHGRENWPGVNGTWGLFSDQYRRQVPAWGLLLDHIGHTVDILQWMSGETFVPQTSNHHDTNSLESWFIQGQLGGGAPVNIWESVRRVDKSVKQAWIAGPFGHTPVPTDKDTAWIMYRDMWQTWLHCVQARTPFPVGLNEAIGVQEVLEAILSLEEPVREMVRV